MVEKAGQVYWMVCNETALLSELKALLASTSKNPSEFLSLKPVLMQWIAALTPEDWPAQNCRLPAAR